jgi:hypothetical protein
MNGNNAVAAPHMLSHERRDIGVGCAIARYVSDEALAERFCVTPQSALHGKTYRL